MNRAWQLSTIYSKWTNFLEASGMTWFIEYNEIKIWLFTFSLLVLYSKVPNIFYYSLLKCVNKSLHFTRNVVLSFSWTSAHTSSFWAFLKDCFPPYNFLLHLMTKKDMYKIENRRRTAGLLHMVQSHKLRSKVFILIFTLHVPWSLESDFRQTEKAQTQWDS